jgi:hypothetical protein
VPLSLLDKRVVTLGGERRRRGAEILGTLKEDVSPIAANRGEYFRSDEVAVGRRRVERLQERHGLGLAEILNVEPAALRRVDGHLPICDRDAARTRVLRVCLQTWAANRKNYRQPSDN